MVIIIAASQETSLQDIRPSQTQTGLHSHSRWLEASNFGFRKKRDCSIYIVRTEALISCAFAAQLICDFVFAYAKSRFSHKVFHFT